MNAYENHLYIAALILAYSADKRHNFPINKTNARMNGYQVELSIAICARDSSVSEGLCYG